MPLMVVAAFGVPAGADHGGVTAVVGSAFGVHAFNISLFTSPLPPNGPVPTVTLPATGSAGPLTATDPDGHVIQYGPAILFDADSLTVSTAGSLGPNGSVLSSATVVGDAVGVDPFRWSELTSTCSATPSAVTGSTTIVGGTVTSTTAVTTVPTNPPPGYEVTGVVPGANDNFRLVFNEQSTVGGVLTVNAAHMYLLGPTGLGDLVIGQSVCGVTVTDANHGPVAADDAYSTDYQTPLTVAAPGVLANDTDADGDALTAAMASDPPNGAVTVNANGSFTYTPDAGFSGTDTFTYMAHDPDDAMDAATVTVTVGAPPPPPPPPGDEDADLTVAVTDGADPVATHGIVTYTVTVANDGPSDAPAMVFLTVPSGARFLEASGAECVELRGRMKGVACDLGTVASGDAATVGIAVRAPGRAAPFAVTATVSSTMADPDPADNIATATTTTERRRD